MNSPFHFGKTVEGEAFTNRRTDIQRLINNFNSGINTVLVSPRKWGKSSLVKRAAKILTDENENIKFCFLDLMKIIDEDDFYNIMARELIRSTSTKPDEIWSKVKNFFTRITPKISFGADPINDFEVNFELKKNEKDYEEILNLPERIAEDKGIKIIICIDEFQDLINFKNPLLFQKRLRSVFQHHKLTSYCFYGSKKDMMAGLFEKKTMPFYKFGDLFFLQKISREDLITFISECFTRTNKNITSELAGRITDLMECHPYYVQQLSHLVWVNTEITATEEIFRKSIEDLLNQNTFFFEREIENLSVSQLKFLKVIADGITDGFTKSEVIEKYGLSTSANVIKVKNYLIQKQILDINKSRISFLDPAFQLWFKENYMS